MRPEFRHALYLVVVAFLLRLVVMLTAPIDLSGDEAYYWEWGRNLDWGYFSKPPMIGWLMGFAGWCFSDTELGIRLMALFLGTGSLLLLGLLTRDLFGKESSFWVLLAVLLTPGNAAANLIFTIDAPLVFSWSLALYSGYHYLTDERNRRKWALLQGIALAIGYLSKQMMLVFPVLWLLCLCTEQSWRAHLKRPTTWLVLLLPLVALVPPLVWNAGHDWITFQHTSGHFAAKSFTLSRSLGWIGEFIGAQLGLITPVTFVILVICLVQAATKWSGTTRAARYLWWFSAPALLVFLLLACRQRILPNWPAVFYVSGVSLCGGLLFGSAGRASMARLVKPFKRGLWIAAALVTLLYAIVYLSPLFPLERDPLERVRGWEAYGQAIAEVDARLWPEREGVENARSILVVGHRYYASELAFYHPEHPRVRLYNAKKHIRSQYGIWENAYTGWAGEILIIDPRKELELPDEIEQEWKRIDLVDTLRIPVTAHTERTVRIYRAGNESDS